MSIENWRKGKWTSLDWKRFWLHLPIGMLCAWLIYSLGAVGIIASVGFMFYEFLEDWRIEDLSFKDMLGFLWGFLSVSAVLSIVTLF